MRGGGGCGFIFKLQIFNFKVTIYQLKLTIFNIKFTILKLKLTIHAVGGFGRDIKNEFSFYWICNTIQIEYNKFIPKVTLNLPKRKLQIRRFFYMK